MPVDERARSTNTSRGHGCARYLEQLRITILLTGMLSQEQVAPDAREALLRVFRDWRASA
jgi:hypothetical protein